MGRIRQLLDTIATTEPAALEASATAIVASIQAGGLLYLFGTGHSHMLAEEGHYRAGGLAAVVPVLATSLMLHESASASTRFERTSDVGPTVLARYGLSDRDTIMIFSNSGVNAAPVEAALAAKATGATVIAVVSLAYAASVPAGPSGRKLADIADIVLDNHGVPGDALVEIEETGLHTGPASTISGAYLLNAILTEVAWRLNEQAGITGATLPIYISTNMPGAPAHNAALIERYRARNPHL
jgi:uncharacterized phosphosugar-binding protein